uniref:Tr-type G domain-containing protein n=1 Tax=Rhabditophanes sp. KR3021 TaxID=114890 RepID=A0AC35UA00_9BILA
MPPKKNKAKKNEKEEDWEAALPEVVETEEDKIAKEKKRLKREKQKQKKNEEEEGIKEEVDVDATEECNKATDEALLMLEKKRLKRERQKQKKEAGETDPEPEPEKKDVKKKGVGNKKMSLLKELLAKKQQEEEDRIEAERLADIAFEERLKQKELDELEAQRKREEKKEAERLRKEDLKRRGLLETAEQVKRRLRAEAFLESKGVEIPVRAAGAEPAKEGGKGTFIIDKKKKKAEALAAEKIRKAKEEEKAAQLAAENEAKAIAEAANKKAEEAKALVENEDLDDWELAEIVIPGAENAPVVGEKAAAPIKKQESVETNDSSDEEEEEESSDDDSSSEDDADEVHKDQLSKEEVATMIRKRFEARKIKNEANTSPTKLRAPVICVLGHVDTGKTLMLDTIRRTNVQSNEAGGITQQIGATCVPAEAIKERCKLVSTFSAEKMLIPGFLIIDTPGHESFANLRNRGSSLCDMAILVVDIMHGLEPQTIESIKLLRKRETPFVIALNKIDRLYGYESNPKKDIWKHLETQPQNTQLEFRDRFNKVFGEFAEQGINVALANVNTDLDDYYSVVPTSAFCGDGIGNVISYMTNFTQERLTKRISFSNELECFVMEVRQLQGLGTAIDVVLLNGTLKRNDILVLTGTDGPIVTPVKDLLMPQPMKDNRVKNEYTNYKKVKGAQGVKICAKNLEKVVAGLPMFVAKNGDELEILKEDADNQLKNALTAIKKKPEGVYVQASTLGSLEALLEFLKVQKIPYSNVNIGPVHKRDVQKAAVMLEHKADYACILAFDVKIDPDAQRFADKEKVKIFSADIIYHLEDAYLKHREELKLRRRKENEHLAIFPCKLRILPENVFKTRDPIVCGVIVESGQLRKGTPICIPSKDKLYIGTVSNIQKNHEDQNIAKKGDEVCIKIDNTTGDAPRLYGRHFTHEDILISRITRETIDVCKSHFRDDLSKEDWGVMVELKRLLDIY